MEEPVVPATDPEVSRVTSRSEERQTTEVEEHQMTEAEVCQTTEAEDRQTTEVEDPETTARRLERAEELRDFREQLAVKRAQRRVALESLRAELSRERGERMRLEALLEEGGGARAEVEGLEMQVRALKDVAKIGGEMLRIRELQVNELKEKLKAIEETGMAYEKEVENMRKLKGLYEERSRAMTISHQMEVEREKLKVVAAETRLEIAEEKNRELTEANKELQERITSLDSTVDKNNGEISELKIQLAGKKEELYNANSQIAIVNNLFSQLLNHPESLDRVTRVMEEHHNLVNHLTEKGSINDVASVLMTVADKDRVLTEGEQDIATNLSKVWRLLVELLGHHNKQSTGEVMPESCYKSVDTPKGPKLVISVSQTFLRLKDLILEKNSLVKEVGRLKDLNTHLEQRLISQEKRLVEVAEELHSTWDVVNKLKSQHKAIHTHEQVLRYELKHKRMMLNELKQQLEECREMWQMARVKNNQTEKDWKLLRKEFADRKQRISSAESGYEESPGDSQDEEDSHKLSDDESDVQDFQATNNPRCLRITRLQDSELSTPDRSNTPDMQVIESPNVEELDDSETSECMKTNESEIPGIETTTEVSSEVDVPIQSETLNEATQYELERSEPNLHVVKPENEALDEDVNFVMNINPLEDSIVELETAVRILPWNDGLEEEHELPSQGLGNIENLNQGHKEDCKILKLPLSSASHSTETMEGEVGSTDAKVTSSPGTSASSSSPPGRKTTAEEILARREERLKRLEEQCKHLFNKMSNTNKRSDIITNKLLELHEHYGESRGEPSTSRGVEIQADSCQSETLRISETDSCLNPPVVQMETKIPEDNPSHSLNTPAENSQESLGNMETGSEPSSNPGLTNTENVTQDQ